MKKLLLCAVLAFGTIFVNSCKTPKQTTTEEACATPAPSYSAEIKAIIETKCATEGCHAKGKGDFRVFENFKRKVDTGQVRDKVIVKKTMPLKGTLTQSEYQAINCWLKDGGKEN
ncbi:MAG: hypothetical protein IPP32_01890 [Bacteroidetes bacterium]|nr:hypothetical protein [Bacteroidota bacterium]